MVRLAPPNPVADCSQPLSAKEPTLHRRRLQRMQAPLRAQISEPGTVRGSTRLQPETVHPQVRTPVGGTFSGVLTGSWGAGLLGAGTGWTGTTAGFGIVSGMSIGCEPGW
jgi:hypothetical protein